MFPISFNFPFRKKDGSLTTIGAEISEGGGGGGYTLPTASAETKGGVKVGSGLSMSGEVLNNSNPNPYSLPEASAETLGGIKVGSGLSISEGVLSVTGGSSSVERFVVNVPSGYKNIPHQELTSIQISITNSSMVGKRIIGANAYSVTGGVTYVLGIMRSITTPLELNEWVNVLVYDVSSVDTVLDQIELYCV